MASGLLFVGAMNVLRMTLAAVVVSSAACGAAPDDDEVRVPAACVGRSPGALVVLDIAGERLQVWITNEAFLEEARRRAESDAPRGVAFFRLVDGEDCDPDHAWHVEPDTATFVDAAIEVCDGRPSDIDADKPYWFEQLNRQFCPWSTQVVGVSALERASR